VFLLCPHSQSIEDLVEVVHRREQGLEAGIDNVLLAFDLLRLGSIRVTFGCDLLEAPLEQRLALVSPNCRELRRLAHLVKQLALLIVLREQIENVGLGQNGLHLHQQVKALRIRQLRVAQILLRHEFANVLIQGTSPAKK